MERNQETSELVRKAEVAPNKVTILDYAGASSGNCRRSFRQIAKIAIPIILATAACTGYSLYQRCQDNLKCERILNTISGIPSMAR